MTQFARPISDFSNDSNGWGNSPLFSKINEISADDTGTQISVNKSSVEDKEAVVELNNSGLSNPNVTNGHIVQVRLTTQTVNVSGGTVPGYCYLMNGGVFSLGAVVKLLPLFASMRTSGTQAIVYIWNSITLSSSDVAKIIDYNDLYLLFGIRQKDFSFDPNEHLSITKAQFQFPDVVASPPFNFEHNSVGELIFSGAATISDVEQQFVFNSIGEILFSAVTPIAFDLNLPDVIHDTEYVITIENPSRDTLLIINNFASAKWVQEANKFSTLTVELSIEGNEDIILLADFPNIMTIQDKGANILDRFIIAKSNEVSGEIKTIKYTCYGLYWFLTKTHIPVFDSNGPRALSSILSSLLQFQITDSPHPISLGFVDNSIASIQRDIHIEKLSIVEVIKSIQETVGGTIIVDENGVLNWFNSITPTSTPRAVNDYNTIQMTRVIHSDLVRTRVIVEGRDEDGNTITAESALLTSSPPYLKYGDVPEFIFDSSIKTQDHADELASSWLTRLSIAPVDLRVSLIDYSKMEAVPSVWQDDSSLFFPGVPNEFSYSINDFLNVNHSRLGDLGIHNIAKLTINLNIPNIVIAELSDLDITNFRLAARTDTWISSLSDNTEKIRIIGSDS